MKATSEKIQQMVILHSRNQKEKNVLNEEILVFVAGGNGDGMWTSTVNCARYVSPTPERARAIG